MVTDFKRIYVSLRRISPAKLVAVGYLSYILVGWILLALPWSHEAEARANTLDHLFSAASAVSTTGLVTVSTPGTYSFFGELVIAILIQFGGLGYMTLGSFVMLASRRKLTEMRKGIAESAFALPEGLDVRVFIRHVVVFCLVIEAIGAIALYFAMRQAGVESPLWHAIFHSVSAFCTAGFSTFPNSLEYFTGNAWINLIIAGLSIFGAIGFIVISDLYLSFTGRRKRVTLTTRIILITTGWMLVLGWAIMFFADPGIAALEPERRLMASGFQAMTAMTTVGFNTYPIGELAMAPVLLIVVLMIVGASPSGTGGGLKSTSVSAVIATMRSVVRGRREITFFGKQVPTHRLHAAYAALGLYVSTLFIGSFLLMTTESGSFQDILFEAASALGTVGLSRGLTGDLTPLGKLIVVALMFVGRVGPMTFGVALFARHLSDRDPQPSDNDVEDVAI